MTPKEAKRFKYDISTRLMDLGNLLFAGILVSLVIDNQQRAVYLVIVGFIAGISPYLFSYLLRK